MKAVQSAMFRVFVMEFYRRQAGFFLFLFLLFFGIVSPSTQLAYHYALITGMFEAPALMAVVDLAWLLYAWKVHRFAAGVLAGPDYLFLHQLKALPPARIYRLFCGVEVCLLAPVWTYALAVAGVGWHLHAVGKAIGVLGYVFLLVLAGVAGHIRGLWDQDEGPGVVSATGPFRPVPYWGILLRFIWRENKLLLAGIKLFSCSILYLLLRTQTAKDDGRIPYLAFGLALFGHGILLYRCRELEMKNLPGYRALPVPIIRRFGAIALFCGLILLPEMGIVGRLLLASIGVKDALSLLLVGYSLLLLLFSLLHAARISTGNYLKLCLVLFGILYVGVLGSFQVVVSGSFLVTALLLFRRGY